MLVINFMEYLILIQSLYEVYDTLSAQIFNIER